MKFSKLKHLLLAAFCLALAVLCPAIQCMQIPEKHDDFEAVVKRGYYGFLDSVGREKFKELGLEDPEETQKKLYELAEAQKLKAREAETERQRIQAQELARQNAMAASLHPRRTATGFYM